MIKDRQENSKTTLLPKEFVDSLVKPFARFFHIEAAGGAILLLFTVAALVLSNSPWAHMFEHVWETQIGLQLGSLEYARSLREWINDGLMGSDGVGPTQMIDIITIYSNSIVFSAFKISISHTK